MARRMIDEGNLRKIVRDEIFEMMSRECSVDEGVDFDYDNYTVSYNPRHQENVDTSVNSNPTNFNLNVNGVEIPIYSIFRRRRSKGDIKNDGNPFVYAMKGERGWKFKTQNDEIKIDQLFTQIARKFVSMFNGRLCVIVPSESPLNYRIFEKIKRLKPNVTCFSGLIRKLTTDEVYEMCVDDENSEFTRYYRNGRRLNAAVKELDNYLVAMDREHGGRFSRHYIRDMEMRKVINDTMRVTEDYFTVSEFVSAVDNSDVLVIDDTVTLGASLKEVCEKLMDECNVKNIMCLTLLSQLSE